MWLEKHLQVLCPLFLPFWDYFIFWPFDLLRINFEKTNLKWLLSVAAAELLAPPVKLAFVLMNIKPTKSNMFFPCYSVCDTNSSFKKEQHRWNHVLVIVAAISVVSGPLALWSPPICPVPLLSQRPGLCGCQCICPLSSQSVRPFLCLDW